jgi:hypothetical protein
MILDLQTLARIEELRIPLEDPASPVDWKDWYHFVLLDRASGVRSLVNVTLAGRPNHGEIQVTFIVNVNPEGIVSPVPPDTKLLTFGTAYSLEWQPERVRRSPLRLQGTGMSLEINGSHTEIAVSDERSQLSIHLSAQAQATPLLVTEDSPFGSGFIGWGLVPGLQVAGELCVGERRFAIDSNWFCYHDRNFGRFRWGEDIGWEWFVAYAECDDGRPLTFVLDWRTNKDHSQGGLPYIFVYVDRQLCKIFIGSSLQIDWGWTKTAVLPTRLPGIMASVFSDRTLRMPQTLQVEAADERDSLSMTVKFDGTSELIVPDNQERQYTFIEEVTGPIQVRLSLQGETLVAKGLVYAEYVQ